MDTHVQQQVNEFLDPRTKKPLWLRFPAELQARYLSDKSLAHDHRPLLVAIGTLIIDLFVFVDYGLDSQRVWHSAVIRLALFTPCALLAIALLRSRRYPSFDEGFCLTISLLATACCIAAAPVFDSVTSINTQIDFILLLSAISTLRMQLPYNLAFIATLFLSDSVYLRSNPWLTGSEKICALSLVACCAVLSIIASYRIELSDRLSYVLLLREELRSEELTHINDTLAALSNRDGLTGLSNRRHFDQCLHTAWERASLDDHPVSLIMTDVDHFKRLNDTYGHVTGDQVLVRLAGILESSIRPEDVLARFGGEEFVLLLPSVDQPEAVRAAERLRSNLRSSSIDVETQDEPLWLSVSCGVATLRPQPGTHASDLVALADEALYRAKRSGRDRVCT